MAGAATKATQQDQLRLLHAAISLSGGKQAELNELLERLESDESGADDLGKLIEIAGLGEPALRTYPSAKQLKLCEAAAKVGKPLPYAATVEGLEETRSWSEGRTIAEWMVSFVPYAWAGLLHGRLSVASVLNHMERVARIAADTAASPLLAERNAMEYDRIVRSRACSASMRKADPVEFAATLSGDREDLITQAERQVKQAEHPAAEGSRPARKGVGAIHHCFRHFFGKCDLQDKGRSCSFHHVCPFCAKPTEGCLDNHLRPLGLTTIRIKDKRALEDGRAKGNGRGPAQPQWNRWSRGDDPRDGHKADRRPSRSRSPRGARGKWEQRSPR